MPIVRRGTNAGFRKCAIYLSKRDIRREWWRRRWRGSVAAAFGGRDDVRLFYAKGGGIQEYSPIIGTGITPVSRVWIPREATFPTGVTRKSVLFSPT
jgi:hypothetical protein